MSCGCGNVPCRHIIITNNDNCGAETVTVNQPLIGVVEVIAAGPRGASGSSGSSGTSGSSGSSGTSGTSGIDGSSGTSGTSGTSPTLSTYGLFNQTGSSVPVYANPSLSYSGSLIDGGVGTLSVPANGFTKGDAFTATFFGELTVVTNGDTLDIHIESDGVRLVDTGEISMPKITAKKWKMDINFSINEIGGAGTAEIATAGLITFRKDASGEVVTEIFSFINNTTFDTTIDNTLVVKAIWGNNPNPGDNIYSKIFTLIKTY